MIAYLAEAMQTNGDFSQLSVELLKEETRRLKTLKLKFKSRHSEGKLYVCAFGMNQAMMQSTELRVIAAIAWAALELLGHALAGMVPANRGERKDTTDEYANEVYR